MKRLGRYCIGFLLGIPVSYKGAMLAGLTSVEAAVITIIAFYFGVIITVIADINSLAGASFVAAAFSAVVAAAFSAVIAAATTFTVIAAGITAVFFTCIFAAIVAYKEESVSLLGAFILLAIEGVAICVALSAGDLWLAVGAVLVGFLLLLRLATWWEPKVASTEN